MKSIINKFLVLNIFIFSISFINAQTSVNQHSIKYIANSSKAVLVGCDGTILITTDNGTIWTPQYSGTGNTLYGVAIYDQNVMFSVGEHGTILRSTDGGFNWELLNSGTTEDLKDIEITTWGNIVICGTNGTLITSNDIGSRFFVQHISDKNLNKIHCLGSDEVYVVGEESTIIKSFDGGYNWLLQSFYPTKYNLKGISGIDENHLIIVGDKSSILKSENAGLSWAVNTRIKGIGSLNDVNFFNENNGIIVGDNSNILITNDGGVTWKRSTISSQVPKNIMSLSFSNPLLGICIGDLGFCLYTFDGGKTWTESYTSNSSKKDLSNKTGSEVNLKSNFPNPFNPTTTISYDISFDANVSIKVYDMAGKVVSELVNSFQKAGSYSSVFNASSLSSGVYFYKITAFNNSERIDKTMRMILTK